MKSLARALLAAVAFLLALIPLTALADGCKLLTEASTISRPGHYCLGRDVEAKEYGIRINSADVDLDLQGHSLVFSQKAEGLAVGVAINDNIGNVKVHNGEINGATIGINITAGTAIVIDRISLKNTGAMGINSVADKVEIKNSVISGVGFRPLAADNAYAIGINLGSKEAVVSNSRISGVKRQNLESSITGEPVGILVTSSCGNCTLTGNEISKDGPDANSYGIWNAALGKVSISKNKIVGFRNGIVSAGHQVNISGNTISCNSVGAQSVGFFSLARDFKKTESFIGLNGNTIKACGMEYLSCMGLACENHAFGNAQPGKPVSSAKTK